jgi:hypothetical protein
MWKQLLAAVFIAGALGVAGAADEAEAQSAKDKNAWCEANCKKLCDLTSRTPAACYAWIPCAATVESRALRKHA